MSVLSVVPKLLRHCPATISLLLIGAIANAQSSTLEQTTVTASRLATASDTTASLSVVDRETLAEVSAVHISEVMFRHPGTWVSRGNGQEHLTAVRSPVLTGAGGCGSFYMAFDGIPIRSNGFCNVNQLADINSEQAERIEVLRGPGMAIHGANALHGVINVISQPADNSPGQAAAIEAGPHDYLRARYSGNSVAEHHAIRLSALLAQDGGYRDDSGYDQQKVTLRHDFSRDTIAVTNLLEWTNLQQETAGYVSGDDAYKDPQRQRENPNPEAFRDSRSLHGYSRWQFTDQQQGDWQITPYFRSTNMQFLMHFLPEQPTENNNEKSLGVQTAYQPYREDNWQLQFGVDAEYTEAQLKQFQQSATVSSFPTGLQYDYSVDALSLAAYVDSQYQLNRVTSLRGGFRLEQQRYDYDNQFTDGNLAEDGSVCVNAFTGATGCRYTRPADRDDHFSDWSANLAVYFSLSDQHSSFVRVARGFRPPQASELYRLQNGQMEPDLDSVAMDSVEWGLEGRYQTLQWQTSLYWMEKDNIIFQDANRLNLDDGASDHIGLEYQLSWRFLPRWQLQINGSLARHRYTRDVSTPGSDINRAVSGNDVDTAPRHFASSQLQWAVTDNSQLELEWLHLGRYYTDINNDYDYPGHDLLNLRWTQQLAYGWHYAVRVNNLSDEYYADRADYSSFGGQRYFIGEQRSVFVELGLDW